MKAKSARTDWILRAGCVLGALAAIVFLGVKPTSGIEELNVVPVQWARYIDARDDLRNVLGFFILGGVMLGIVPRRGWLIWSRGFVLALLVLLLLVPALESVQHFLPGRKSDARDLLTGWLGVALALALVSLLRLLLARSTGSGRTPADAGASDGDSD